MSNLTEDQLYNMSDEDLEKAFFDAKMEMGNEEPIEEVSQEPEEIDDGQDNLGDQESDLDGAEEEVTEGTDTDSEPTDSDPDGDTTEGKEQAGEVTEGAEKEAQPVQKTYKYKAAGKEYEFTEQEIMEKFPQIFGQAIDYTKKMQAIKPWRKTIDAIEQAQLTNEDISLMIDVLKGDKAAIASVLKRTGVDTLDLDTENDTYVPKSYGRDEHALQIKDVVDEISVDPEFETTNAILSRQWDANSFRKMTENPEMIKLLHMDVKNGLYNVIQPMAEKLKLYDGAKGSDLDYYGQASVQYARMLQSQQQAQQATQVEAGQKQKVAEVKKAQEVRKTTAQDAAKRKAAAPTKTGSSKPPKVTDYLDPSSDEFEEAFAEWDKKLMASK